METIKSHIKYEIDHYGKRWPAVVTWILLFIGIAGNIYQVVHNV
jgi:hypothetical protein